MIIVQVFTSRGYLFEDLLAYSANPITQVIYWELITLSVFSLFVIINIYMLYNIQLKSKNQNLEIRSIQLLYLSVLIFFLFSFYIFLISSLFATYLVENAFVCNVFKWIEFISCIITAFFCFFVHIVYFIYKYKVKNISNKTFELEESLSLFGVREHNDPNIVGKISEIIMFALFQFIMVQIMSNLLYFNVALNFCVNTILIILLEMGLMYFGDVGSDTIGTISIALVVLLYFIPIYKSTKLATMLNNALDSVSVMFSENTNLQATNLLLNTNLNDSYDALTNISQSLNDVQSKLTQTLSDKENLQTSVDSLNLSNDQLESTNAKLSAYQVQSITNQLNINIKMLQQHISYFSQLQALFVQLQQQLITDSPDVTGESYFLGYSNTIGALSDQANTLLTSAQVLLTGVGTIQNGDISTFNSNLNALINNVNFIRSHIFFTVPSSVQGQDSVNFNLLYEFGFKVFARFFRNRYSTIIPWCGSNENVVRDTIMYIKKTSTIYNSLSVYSQGVVSDLYALMDGDTVWNLLGGNLNNDTNTAQMNSNILNNSRYGQIYTNGGIEYCTLLFSLASQPEFFETFDNTLVQQSFSWQLFPLILEYMESFSDSSFGSSSIQSM